VSPPSALEALASRDRAIAIGLLAAAIALSWAYLFAGAGMEHHDMDGMSMPAMRVEWTPGYFALMALMWSVMMTGMMLPSAAPMILLHGAIHRRRAAGRGALRASALFILGYLVTWTGFSLAATFLQWALVAAALLSPMMDLVSRGAAGALLIAAGLYQWTSFKQSCLRRCRSPLDFVMAYWREGAWGSFVMGLRHGGFCLGCCWLLMLLLFVGGAMNLLCVAGLTLFVLVEKLAPAGHWVGRAAGAALVAWGGLVVMGLAGV
jgi:predicted metal-binding membrane protein